MTNLKNTFAFLLLFTGTCVAQEVDTIEINGEQIFVYPFRVEAIAHSDYYRAVKIQKMNYRPSYDDYRVMWEEEFGDVLSKRQFRKFVREMRNFGSRDRSEETKYLGRKFVKAVRKNPYPLLQQDFDMNNDVIPVLDPIPDGKYVQYYSPFCVVNEDGECDGVDNLMDESQFDDLVAGYFTIKNNSLHGEATWIDLRGDTLKHGWFENGLKVGEWKSERRYIDYSIDEVQANLYIERGYPDIDTTIEYITYANGAENGRYRKFENSQHPIEEGYYTDGEETGTWTYRNITYQGIGFKRYRVRNNELISSQFTYESDKDLVAHPRWMRKDLVSWYGVDLEQFNFYSTYALIEPPQKMFEIAYPQEENLELEEEIEGAPYDLDHFESEYDQMYESEYGYEGEYGYGDDYYGYGPYEAMLYDENAKKSLKRGVLLDSIGGRPRYTGTYEAIYPNGQIAYRYVFEKGNLVKEDTIFWDNGVAHDVFAEVPDSSQYLRSIYDYDGKLYLEILYDERGDFVRIKKSHEIEKEYELDGLKVDLAPYGGYYYYNGYDTLDSQTPIEEPTYLYRSWAEADSTLMFTSSYYPDGRKLISKGYSVTNNEMMLEERSFSEDFESWTGKKYFRVGDLELVETNSGSLYEYVDKDSIPVRNISRSYDIFDVATEYKLKKGDQPYTGSVELNFDAKRFSISKKGLKIGLPKSEYTSDKLAKDIRRYRAKGKTKYPLIMGLIDATEIERGIGEYVFSEFFYNPLGRFFTDGGGYYYDEYYGDYGYEGGNGRRGKQRRSPILTKVEGFMMDGEPQGLWIGYDQYGEKMLEVPYSEGEADGVSKTYAYEHAAEKLSRREQEMFEEYYEDPLQDSLPEKRVHYISNEAHYKNGKANGKDFEYTWYGDIIRESNYLDGELHGPSIERNPLAITEVNYKYGSLDGYVRTYLTLTPGDSILLYNLNFQDGLLQGESKSFHTNGKLSKRGFFLDGQPIEDYEAYDSLGFKYHYVKFKYSFPVEEKIWEENQLSVRYQFDWEDSIQFEPSDITSSQSLDAIIAKLGLGEGYFDQPYYGRPSLVNKYGVNYHMTKYYPNDTISRDGDLADERKTGLWKYYSYNGELLYEVDYKDSIIVQNDSIKFKSKGILTDFDENGNALYTSHVIEMFSKYDCSHSDHYEIRQLKTIWSAHDSLGRMDGYVKNYYDNGTLQSEGNMKDGLPDGIWKIYDPYGKLNQYGLYVQGKRNARWLSGDLSKTKYLGDICLNPNLPDLEEEIKYRENLLDIKITNYHLGKELNRQYYDVNMNRFMEEQEWEEEGEEGEEGEEEDTDEMNNEE